MSTAKPEGLAPRLVFGAATLEPGGGGIARVARLSLKALQGAGAAVEAGALLDAAGGAADIDAKRFGGSKAAFLAWSLPALWRAQGAMYDSVGPARSHPIILGQARPYWVWGHGVEVWEPMTARSRRTLGAARGVFFNSFATKQRHEALHGPRANGDVCWLATEDDAAPPRGADFSGPPTALIVGRIDDREWGKGHAELIETWPAVVARVPQARLVIAGGGRGLERVRAMAQASSAAAAIEVLGFVPQERIDALMQEAHVFAMPSRQEGFGIVYAEAMRYGLPCIASRQDSGQEVTVHDETGLNVDLTIPAQLTDALTALLSSTDRSRAFGAAGFSRWRRHFSYSAFAQRFVPLWRARAMPAPTDRSM